MQNIQYECNFRKKHAIYFTKERLAYNTRVIFMEIPMSKIHLNVSQIDLSLKILVKFPKHSTEIVKHRSRIEPREYHSFLTVLWIQESNAVYYSLTAAKTIQFHSKNLYRKQRSRVAILRGALKLVSFEF